MKAMLSIVGLYNYDEKILDGIQPYIPIEPSDKNIATEYAPIDFDVLKNTILFRAAELCLLYTEPHLFKLTVGMWAAKNRLTWQKLYDTLYYKYDPLFSKIRAYTLNRATHDKYSQEKTGNESDVLTQNTDDERTIKTTGNENDVISGKTVTAETSSNTEVESRHDENTLYVQAFNDINPDKWYGKERTVNNGNTTTQDSGGKDVVSTDTGNNDRNFIQNVLDSLDGKMTRDLTKRINEEINRNDNGTLQDIISETITGQRPFQELIDLQRQIVQFNLYDFIADDFVKNFCVMIY